MDMIDIVGAIIRLNVDDILDALIGFACAGIFAAGVCLFVWSQRPGPCRPAGHAESGRPRRMSWFTRVSSRRQRGVACGRMHDVREGSVVYRSGPARERGRVLATFELVEHDLVQWGLLAALEPAAHAVVKWDQEPHPAVVRLSALDKAPEGRQR